MILAASMNENRSIVSEQKDRPESLGFNDEKFVHKFAVRNLRVSNHKTG